MPSGRMRMKSDAPGSTTPSYSGPAKRPSLRCQLIRNPSGKGPTSSLVTMIVPVQRNLVFHSQRGSTDNAALDAADWFAVSTGAAVLELVFDLTGSASSPLTWYREYSGDTPRRGEMGCPAKQSTGRNSTSPPDCPGNTARNMRTPALLMCGSSSPIA